MGIRFKSVAVAAVCLGALVASSSAMAAEPTGVYAPFKGCPYTDTAVTGCVVSSSTGGAIKLGNASVPLSAATPIALQGGITLDGATLATTFYDAAPDFETLPRTKLKVPGGLFSVVKRSGPVIDMFRNAAAQVNDLYATAEQAGPVQFNYLNLLTGVDDPSMVLPIKVHLENPFLGPSCYIGSNANPITLKLTVGTTHPPVGTAPLTGTVGDATTTPDGSVAIATGAKFVDNTFAVPAATNCGYGRLGKVIVTAGVNLTQGLPAAAGKSSAILQGTALIGDRQAVQDSVQ